MKYIPSVFSAVAAVIILSAFSSENIGITDSDILNATKHLEKFEKMNYEPKYIAPVQAAACAPANASASSSGVDPHTGRYINVYVNDKGFAEMSTKKKPVFPEGTMILKEKIGHAGETEINKYGQPELFTVMIKREKGFNAECGDWEFATVEVKTSKIERGKTPSCMGCHKNYKGTDFVKRDYLSLKYVKQLK